mmetsp:Transcript_85285/g.241835  ORF Transcript_85285/g.241835 Transcript_85285/m.241835 type:complete len:316 (+) Transcript_85285:260-1207(+)
MPRTGRPRRCRDAPRCPPGPARGRRRGTAPCPGHADLAGPGRSRSTRAGSSCCPRRSSCSPRRPRTARRGAPRACRRGSSLLPPLRPGARAPGPCGGCARASPPAAAPPTCPRARSRRPSAWQPAAATSRWTARRLPPWSRRRGGSRTPRRRAARPPRGAGTRLPGLPRPLPPRLRLLPWRRPACPGGAPPWLRSGARGALASCTGCLLQRPRRRCGWTCRCWTRSWTWCCWSCRRCGRTPRSCPPRRPPRGSRHLPGAGSPARAGPLRPRGCGPAPPRRRSAGTRRRRRWSAGRPARPRGSARGASGPGSTRLR